MLWLTNMHWKLKDRRKTKKELLRIENTILTSLLLGKVCMKKYEENKTNPIFFLLLLHMNVKFSFVLSENRTSNTNIDIQWEKKPPTFLFFFHFLLPGFGWLFYFVFNLFEIFIYFSFYEFDCFTFLCCLNRFSTHTHTGQNDNGNIILRCSSLPVVDYHNKFSA